MERILSNLVSNAIRYTDTGGVVVGCRLRGDQLRIEVLDSGVGIPPDQQQQVFVEFWRMGKHDPDQQAGLGLGLAIVDRLCRLLNHRIGLTSIPGKGSCFSVTVPMARRATVTVPPPQTVRSRLDVTNGKLIVVIDDDPLVLEGMGGLLRSWGCLVIAGSSDRDVLTRLAAYESPPDVIISDYQLQDGLTGVEAIARLCTAYATPIGAFLMSGDTNPAPLRDSQANGYPLLHKPVNPMALRATLTQVISRRKLASRNDRGESAALQAADQKD